MTLLITEKHPDTSEEKVEYGIVSGVDKPVSKLIYGTENSVFRTAENYEKNCSLLDACFNEGINTFDTARVYGEAEKLLGKWIHDRDNREKVVIVTKGGHPTVEDHTRLSKKEIFQDLELSLNCLNLEYVDILLAHRDNANVPVGEIVEILNELIEKGRVKAYGVSNWTKDRIAEANKYAEQHDLKGIAVSSPHYGLAKQKGDIWGYGCVSISEKNREEERKWYEENHMPVFSYSSLGRGMFSGKYKSWQIAKMLRGMDRHASKAYINIENLISLKKCEKISQKTGYSIPQIALAWIYNQRLNGFAVITTSNEDNIHDDCKAVNIDLSMDSINALETL